MSKRMSVGLLIVLIGLLSLVDVAINTIIGVFPVAGDILSTASEVTLELLQLGLTVLVAAVAGSGGKR